MHKLLLTLVLSLIFKASIAQTNQLEIDNLARRFENEEFSALDYKGLAKEWQDLLEEFNGYPVLPYDEEAKYFVYEHKYNFEGFSKKEIYNRVIEWIAISFGHIDAVMRYQNLETGRIIFKGLFPIRYEGYKIGFWGKPTTKTTPKGRLSSQIYVVTIVDENIKIEVLGIRYAQSDFIDITNVYDKYEVYLEELFPITNYEPEYWREILNVMRAIVEGIEKNSTQLAGYILAQESYEDY